MINYEICILFNFLFIVLIRDIVPLISVFKLQLGRTRGVPAAGQSGLQPSLPHQGNPRLFISIYTILIDFHNPHVSSTFHDDF
jgi:hypothetical protein